MKREALYNLVWAVPVSKLARQFELSDRGLAKLCQREGIPVPPRGYWAKLAAGHPVRQTPLPEPMPGQSEWISAAPTGSAFGAEGRAWLAKRTAARKQAGAPPFDDASCADPEPPIHNHDVHVVAWRACSAIGNVRVRKRELQAALHPTITRLLREDRGALERERSWYLGYDVKRPLTGAGPRRRLGLLNALFLALEKAGARADVSDQEGRAIVVTVGRMIVHCRMESTWMRTTRRPEREERLDFHVSAGGNSFQPLYVEGAPRARAGVLPPGNRDWNPGCGRTRAARPRVAVLQRLAEATGRSLPGAGAAAREAPRGSTRPAHHRRKAASPG